MKAMSSMGLSQKPSKEVGYVEKPSLVTDNSTMRVDYSTKSSIILEDPDDDLSIHDSRPSLENHASARDLMAHLHGMTPVQRRNFRPARLSLQNIGAVSTNGIASKHNISSPFPQFTTSMKSSTIKSATYDIVET